MSNQEEMKGKKKKWWIIVVAILVIGGIGSLFQNNEDEIQKPNDETSMSTKKTKSDTTSNQKTKSEKSTTEKTTEIKESSALDDISVIFSEFVRNDVTGNWRMAKVTGNKSTEEYAVDYYKKYFKAENEVHIIVNFTLNTTSILTYGSGEIYVRIYEHIDGEEQDAKKIPAGKSLAEYHINF